MDTELPIDQRKVEECILFTVQEITESVYEKFSEGALSVEELRAIYVALHKWAQTGERLLNLLN